MSFIGLQFTFFVVGCVSWLLEIETSALRRVHIPDFGIPDSIGPHKGNFGEEYWPFADYLNVSRKPLVYAVDTSDREGEDMSQQARLGRR